MSDAVRQALAVFVAAVRAHGSGRLHDIDPKPTEAKNHPTTMCRFSEQMIPARGCDRGLAMTLRRKIVARGRADHDTAPRDLALAERNVTARISFMAAFAQHDAAGGPK